MVRILQRTQFAAMGDKETIPQTSGTDEVNYQTGYTARYAEDTEDPSSLDIGRFEFNELMFALSGSIQEFQFFGNPAFISTAENGGTPFPYTKGAVVSRNGLVYMSLVNTNTTVPPSVEWELQDLNAKYDKTGGDITGNVDIINSPLRLKNAGLASVVHLGVDGTTAGFLNVNLANGTEFFRVDAGAAATTNNGMLRNTGVGYFGLGVWPVGSVGFGSDRFGIISEGSDAIQVIAAYNNDLTIADSGGTIILGGNATSGANQLAGARIKGYKALNGNDLRGGLTLSTTNSGGTLTPGLTMDDVQRITYVNQQLGAGGSATAPNWSFSSDTNMGMYREASNLLGFSVAGVNGLSLGVGSATFSGNVHVAQNILSNNSTSDLIIAGGSAGSFDGSNITLYGGAHATLANDMRFRAGATETLYYDSSAGVWDFKGNALVGVSGFNITGQFLAEAGTQTLPAYSFLSDTDTGMYLDNPGTLSWTVSGTEMMQLDGNGVSIYGLSFLFGDQVMRAGDKVRAFDNTGALSFVGGITEAVGSSVVVNGSTSTDPLGISFRAAGVDVLRWRNSANVWDYQGTNINGVDDLTLTGNITGVNNIVRSTGTSNMIVSGGGTASLGGVAKLYGQTHLTKPSHIELIEDTTIRLAWNTTSWDFRGNALSSVGTVTKSNAFFERDINTDRMSISGGDNSITGANFVLFGGAHPNTANDILLRSGATNQLSYDDSASQWSFNTNELTGVGRITLATGAIIRDSNDSNVILSGGTGTATGANIVLFGGAHPTQSNDIELRAGGSTKLRYDASTSTWDFSNNVVAGLGNMFGASSLGGVSLAGGTAAGLGGRIILRAQGHADANNIVFLDGGTVITEYEAATNLWNYHGKGLNNLGNIDMSSGDRIVRGIATNALFVSGGTGNGVGGNLVMYGEGHATKAGDIELRTNTSIRMHWDDSVNLWDFRGNNVTGINQLTIGDEVRVPNGTPSDPSYTFSSDSNTGMYLPGGDLLGFTAGGGERFRVTITGVRTLANGSAATPAYTFNNDPDTGTFLVTAGVFGITTGGVQRAQFSSTGLALVNGSAGQPAYNFTSDPNTGMYRVGADTVGLTCNGTVTLTVAPTFIRSAAQFQGIDGSATGAAYAFSSDGDTGAYLVSAGVYGITTGGTLQMSISGNAVDLIDNDLITSGDLEAGNATFAGDVSIGGVTPAFSSGSGLHINAPSVSRLHLTTDLTGTTGADGFDIAIAADSSTFFSQRENASMFFFVNGSEALELDASQNATFAGNIFSSASTGDLVIAAGPNTSSGANIVLNSAGSGNPSAMLFRRGGTTTLTLGNDGNATFAGQITGNGGALLEGSTTANARFTFSQTTGGFQGRIQQGAASFAISALGLQDLTFATNGATRLDISGAGVFDYQGNDLLNVGGLSMTGNLTTTGTISGDGAIPAGGTTNQVLTKSSGTDYSVVWADAGGGGSLPASFNIAPDAPDNTFSIATSGAASFSNDLAIAGIVSGDGTIPAGGTTNQVLTKSSGTDYAATWQDAGGGGGLPASFDINPAAPPASLSMDALGNVALAHDLGVIGDITGNGSVPVGGTNTQVLTKGAGGDYDVSWQNAGGGGGGTQDQFIWANVLDTGLSTVGMATLGMAMSYLFPVNFNAITAMLTTVAGATYAMKIVTMTQTGTILSIAGTAAEITTVTGSSLRTLVFTFPATVNCVPGVFYAFLLTRTDSTATYILPLNDDSAGSDNTAWPALPIVPYDFTGATTAPNTRVRIASVNPQIGDNLTVSGNTATVYAFGFKFHLA